METVIFTGIGLGVGLAMDAFAVSMSNGLKESKMRFSKVLLIAFMFGLFQGVMPLIGYLVGNSFVKYIEKFIPFIALALLSFLGIKMIIDFIKERKYKDNMIQIYNMELFIMLERFKRTRKDILNNTDIIINNVSNYIRENYGRTITLEELSIKFGISKEHLSRQFKSILGIGFNDYVTYIRIQNAEKLLKENKISMVDIASQCGFNSYSYFAAVFKKIKGITPYKYSKLFSLYSSSWWKFDLRRN